MQANKKTNAPDAVAEACHPAAPLSGVSATDDGSQTASGLSPARALQIRLAREISAPRRDWLWHSEGLVLALLLSLSLAGIMLETGI
jgi:hypothetical protein